jgi:uncharacterized protein YkwD
MRKTSTTVVAVVIAFIFAAVSISSEADADSAAVEVALLGSINAGRAAIGKPPLLMHNGLREQQRGHARYMSGISQLTHDGFSQRASSATPDPVETNGAPDDGFTGFNAENIAQNFRNGRTDTDIAEAIYQQWFNSPGHKTNMFDEQNRGYNAAGVGIFEEASGKIWAALLLSVDSTPPGGDTISPTPTPTPKKNCKRHRRPRCRRR